MFVPSLSWQTDELAFFLKTKLAQSGAKGVFYVLSAPCGAHALEELHVERNGDGARVEAPPSAVHAARKNENDHSF